MSTAKKPTKRAKKPAKVKYPHLSDPAPMVLHEEASLYACRTKSSQPESMIQEEKGAPIWTENISRSSTHVGNQKLKFWHRRPNAELDRAGEWLLANLAAIRREAKSRGNSF